jgi:Oxidoreductase molybdopterin binding domain
MMRVNDPDLRDSPVKRCGIYKCPVIPSLRQPSSTGSFTTLSSSRSKAPAIGCASTPTSCPRRSASSGIVTLAIFTFQSRDALIGRRQGNQWLGEFHGGTGPLQNPLFLANVTLPRHALTILAYEMSGAPVGVLHGAPLRLRCENELGFKMVKWVTAIEFVHDFADLGAGHGGYNEDHEFYGYGMPI